MKNLFLFLSLLSLIFACQKESIEEGQNSSQKTTPNQSFRSNLISYNDFISYGELHNNYLTNAKNNFSAPSNVNSLEEAVEYVNDFNIAYAQTLSISNEDKAMYNDLLTASKDYVVTETFMNTFVSPNGSYYQKVQELFDLGGIDEFEKNSLIEIGQKAFDNYNEDLSTNTFEVYLSTRSKVIALKTTIFLAFLR